MPFSKIDDFDLEYEILGGFSLPLPNTNTGKSTPILNKSDVETIVNSVNNNSRNNIVDSFSQVYCDYVSVNDLPFAFNEEDPNNFSIFHSNVISLKHGLLKE